MDFTLRNSMCRLCLCSNESFIDIFLENESQGFDVVNVMEELLQLRVSEVDGYPKVVCPSCLTKLTEFQNFKQQCRKSYDTYDTEFRPRGDSHEQHNFVTVKIEPTIDEEDVSFEDSGEREDDSATPIKDEIAVDDYNPWQTQQTEHLSNPVGEYDENFSPASLCEVTETKVEVTENLQVPSSHPEVIVPDYGMAETGGPTDEDSSFPCERCGQVFFKYNHLNLHCMFHGSEDEFICIVCFQGFTSKNKLSEHLATHSTEKSFQCNLCDKKYASLYSLNYHRKRHSGEGLFTCSTCSKTFTKFSHLKIHMNIHSGVRSFKCTLCPKKFLRSSHLTRHLRTHEYKCGMCSVRFKEFNDLQAHMEAHMYPDKPQPIWKTIHKKYAVCKNPPNSDVRPVVTSREEGHDVVAGRWEYTTETVDCGGNPRKRKARSLGRGRNEEQNESRLLDNAIETSSNSDGKSKMEKNPGRVEEEVSSKYVDHGTERAVETVTPTNMEQEGHPKSSDKSGEKTFYECEFCFKLLRDPYSLKYHMRKHTGDQVNVCHVCSKHFIKSSHLREHLKIHEGYKPYTCEVCSKTFLRLSHLKRHRNIHSVEKPFVCSVCSAGFRLISQLNSHVKTHLGDKIYDCKECSKRFNRSSHLASHLRTHSGERPYQCSICSKRFLCGSHLKRHLKTQHDNEEEALKVALF